MTITLSSRQKVVINLVKINTKLVFRFKSKNGHIKITNKSSPAMAEAVGWHSELRGVNGKDIVFTYALGNSSRENTINRHVFPQAPSPTTTNFFLFEWL